MRAWRTIGDEPLGLLGSAEVAVGQAEDTDGRLGQGVALSGATANRVVLGEDDPAVLARVAQPDLVGQKLPVLLAVDVGH